MPGSEEYDKLISELFSKHRQMMYKMAFVILKNPVDAEDAVQIAFIHISKHTENISQRSDKDREGYLIKTIKNVCHDLIMILSISLDTIYAKNFSKFLLIPPKYPRSESGVDIWAGGSRSSV